MSLVDSAASAVRYIRRTFTTPDMDADGWYTRGAAPAAPELDVIALLDANDNDLDRAWAALDRDRRNDRLGTALPCARWRREVEHDDHVWDNDGAVAQCPGWRGEP